MRTSSVFVLLATMLAQQALAVPTPFQDSLERRVNGQADWGTVPDDKKFQVTGKVSFLEIPASSSRLTCQCRWNQSLVNLARTLPTAKVTTPPRLPTTKPGNLIQTEG